MHLIGKFLVMRTRAATEGRPYDSCLSPRVDRVV